MQGLIEDRRLEKMSALPIQFGPSETVGSTIEWLGRLSERMIRAALGGEKLAYEMRDLAASLSHLYGLLAAEHDAWLGRISSEPVESVTLAVGKQFEEQFNKWHAAAVSVIESSRRLAGEGIEVEGVDRLRDLAGFCPYVGISIEELMRRGKGSEKDLVSLRKVRDGLRRRVDAQGR